MGNNKRRASLSRSRRRPSWISASDSLSRLEVASSRIRIRGSASSGASDRDPLPLTAGEFYTAFADDGVVAVRKFLDKFVGVRDPAHLFDLFEEACGICKSNVVEDRAVKEKIVLQHDTQDASDNRGAVRACRSMSVDLNLRLSSG